MKSKELKKELNQAAVLMGTKGGNALKKKMPKDYYKKIGSKGGKTTQQNKLDIK